MANQTAREQEFLELLNRLRINPATELPLLLNSTDPQVVNNLNYFNVDRTILATQWSTLVPAAPLAWSSQLSDAAITHNQVMIRYDQQSHDVGLYDSSGNLITAYEPDLGGRLTAAGYNFTNAGENIFAYASSIFGAEAALAIDWGFGPGGIQSPAGHRINMMSRNFREVGISAVDETNPSTLVGPLVVTEEFGNRSALNGKGWLLGVAFQDTNKNGWYEAGEGLADVSVRITGINGTTFAKTITVESTGGFQDLLNPGQYQIDFLRNGAVISTRSTLINTDNVKVDLLVTVPTVAPVLTRNDFNGDKKSEILWHNNTTNPVTGVTTGTGNIAIWTLNGTTVTSAATSTAALPLSWKTAGTGDFNGDNKTDVLWRNDNGTVVLWQMDGATVTSSTAVAQLAADWKIAGTGDFTGDGKSDLLWRNNNGSVVLWQMNGATITSSNLTSTPALDSSWKIAATGDFTGDGKADILWRNDNGTIALWQMNGSTVTASTAIDKVSTDWKIAGTDDFNGDGKTDLLWRNDIGTVALWTMDGAIATTKSLTSAPSVDSTWKIAGTGDFNSDGKADIFWRNDNGATSVWQMNGANIIGGGLTSVPTVDSTWKVAVPMSLI
jgi:uncharacterized protein YkwD